MSSEDIIAGATKGALDWSVEFIKSLVEKFKDRKIAFIEDEETIKIVKEQYNSGELNFYKAYIQDKELLFIVKLGLTLRRMESDSQRRNNLRDKIFRKYEIRGLRIAQFVENGILNRYIGILIDNLFNLNRGF
jgi:FixJ family two-component response regulator